MNTLESIVIGIALSAACGFRIFVPPLVMSVAAIYGHLPLSPGFEWMGTYPALYAFGIATIIEIGAYYIPLVDNLLDTVATPTAIAFGTWIAAALLPNTDPLLKWTMAVLAGGGSAGIIQALTSFTRLSSTALTVGLGNSVITTIEAITAFALSGLAIFMPLLAIGLVIGLLFFSFSKGFRIFALKRQS
jgi:hypothetical protein